MTSGITPLLASRRAPLVFGVLTALIAALVWGSLDAVPLIHDETAYLFQAKLFASGRWAAPTPPFPEFFEQYHLLVAPSYTSKYWPGHSLLLAPGIWLGLPGLIPLVLDGVSGGLLFALARRMANGWVALLTWLFWSTAPANLIVQNSYISQVTTAALWFLGWWALLRWRETGRPGPLLLVAASIGWGVLTRPLTTVAFALPVAVVVFRSVSQRHLWRQLGAACALGSAILVIIPVWSARTTGDWLATPYVLHTRTYLPYYRLGFGENPARLRRDLPPDMRVFEEQYRRIQRAHTLEALGRTLRERLRAIAGSMWSGWRLAFSLTAILGALILPTGAFLSVGTAGLLVSIYLLYAHPPQVTNYYYEIQGTLAFLTALGIWWVAWTLAERRPPRREQLSVCPKRAVLFVLFAWVAMLPGTISDLAESRRLRREWSAYPDSFRKAVASIPATRGVLFVRYAPGHNVHRALIHNDPDVARSRIWIVHDRGSENAKLLASAPDRTPYLFDEALGRISPMTFGRRRSLRERRPRGSNTGAEPLLGCVVRTPSPVGRGAGEGELKRR